MPTVTVVAIRDFVHEGRRYKRGDNVTMTAIEAAVEAQKHHVSLLERPKPAPAPDRTYRRQDIQPHSSDPLVTPAPVTESSKAKRRGRRSRRQDLVARS